MTEVIQFGTRRLTCGKEKPEEKQDDQIPEQCIQPFHLELRVTLDGPNEQNSRAVETNPGS